MATRAILNLRSGNQNPQFTLAEKAERDLQKRLSKLKTAVPTRLEDVRPFGVLSFTVIHDGDRGRGAFRCGGGLVQLPFQEHCLRDDAGIERLLISAIPDSALNGARKRKLLSIIDDDYRVAARKVLRQRCKGPLPNGYPYNETFYWDPVNYVNYMFCNNCYDYANYRRTDSYSQPGVGGGLIYLSHSAADMTAAAIRDGLTPVTTLTPTRRGRGWYVALLLGTDGLGDPDFHWIKQDISGCWSHKLGPWSPQDTDSNHNRIQSPKTATFKYSGLMAYPIFVGFFLTNDNVTIQGLLQACYGS